MMILNKYSQYQQKDQNTINKQKINDNIFTILAKSNNQNVYISNMFFSIWSSNCDYNLGWGNAEFLSTSEILLKSINWFY